MECITENVTIMWRSTSMLKNYNFIYPQLQEGIVLEHVKVHGSINSGLSEEKPLHKFHME
jgi:hypothetical protein